jgi:hypothetical protein
MKIRNIIMNRKGSTLALTIIIFAVLMIFATFTLGFMVTENKQAMYYQNKTQAYYIAKSAADISDAAIRQQLRTIFDSGDQTDVNQYIQKLDEWNLELSKESVEENLNADNINIYSSIQNVNGNDVLAIDVDVIYNGVSQSIRKIITSSLAISSGTENTFDYKGLPVVAITGAWRTDKDNGADISDPSLNNGIQYAEIVGEDSIFKPYVFPEKIWESGEIDGPVTITQIIYDDEDESPSIVEVFNSDVTINSDITIDNRIKVINIHGDLLITGNISVPGNVVFNIKGNLYINGIDSINSDGESDDCEFFVYNENNETVGLDMDLSDNLNAKVYANFYVKQGKTDIDLKKSYFEGDIISNDVFSGTLKDGGVSSDSQIPSSQYDYNVKIISDDSSNQINFNGSVWAPDSYVVSGGDVVASNKNAILQDGMLLGKFVEIEGNNHNKNFDFLDTLLANSMDGTEIPVEIETEADVRALTFDSYYTD